MFLRFRKQPRADSRSIKWRKHNLLGEVLENTVCREINSTEILSKCFGKPICPVMWLERNFSVSASSAMACLHAEIVTKSLSVNHRTRSVKSHWLLFERLWNKRKSVWCQLLRDMQLCSLHTSATSDIQSILQQLIIVSPPPFLHSFTLLHSLCLSFSFLFLFFSSLWCRRLAGCTDGAWWQHGKAAAATRTRQLPAIQPRVTPSHRGANPRGEPEEAKGKAGQRWREHAET